MADQPHTRSAPAGSSPAAPPPGGLREGAPGADSFVRRTGKSFIIALHGALRAIELYPVENAAVQRAVSELVNAADALIARDHDVTLRVSGQVMFINDVRLRLELDSYRAFNQVLAVLHASGVGRLSASAEARVREWLTLLLQLRRGGDSTPEWRFQELSEKLQLAGLRCFELGPAVDEPADAGTVVEAKEASKRLYARSVAVARDVLQSVRVGRPPSLRRLKRAVQGIVDQILSDETPLMGLTTLRDFDEYTFTHSVNVGIFSVAIGKRLGLSKVQLYDLGLAAVLHDMGKTRLPLELIGKRGGLAPDEWALIQAHPWLGVLAMFELQHGTGELPLRAMRVSFEHHRKVDGSGYPSVVRPRDQGLFSRIVAVADGFDAATSQRSYQQTPRVPSEVLRGMIDNPERGMDPVLVKALVNTLGIYPIGTLVVIDSLELAIVHGPPSGPEVLSRPVVRVVSDALGNPHYPGYLLDLAERDGGGNFVRSIINTADPARYGIRISDYFV